MDYVKVSMEDVAKEYAESFMSVLERETDIKNIDVVGNKGIVTFFFHFYNKKAKGVALKFDRKQLLSVKMNNGIFTLVMETCPKVIAMRRMRGAK